MKKKNAGFWIENQPEEIQRTIDHFFSMTEEQQRRMKDNARELAEEYKPDNIFLRYENMYEEVLKKCKKYA